MTIPRGVKSIGYGAFSSCGKLRSVKIPDTVTKLSHDAFNLCYLLDDISVDENNPEYRSIDGSLYTKDGKTLIKAARKKSLVTFTIPEGVEIIERGALPTFHEYEKLIIPNSVRKIENNNFDKYKSIEFKNPVGWVDTGKILFKNIPDKKLADPIKARDLLKGQTGNWLKF